MYSDDFAGNVSAAQCATIKGIENPQHEFFFFRSTCVRGGAQQVLGLNFSELSFHSCGDTSSRSALVKQV